MATIELAELQPSLAALEKSAAGDSDLTFMLTLAMALVAIVERLERVEDAIRGVAMVAGRGGR